MTGMLYREPKLISGEGSLLKVPGMLQKAGHQKVLVATTPGFIRRGSLQPFFDELDACGIEATVFSEVVPDPTIECVEELVTAYHEGDCKAIVAIGGGSVMDCAKVAGARVVCPGKTIRDMKGALKIHRKLPDFYAVPTTAGTGSECTVAAVVTDTVDGRHYKYAVADFCMTPKVAVLDPALTVDLPPHMTAATGMDALTHAVEAYTNRFASNKVKYRAVDAVHGIHDYLLAVYEDGSNMEARTGMLEASYNAGIAFSNNFVGYVHAIAHGIGALYGVPHGLANAIILPYVMEQYGTAAYKELAVMAEVVEVQHISADNRRLLGRDEMAREFIQWIRDMNEKMGIPDKIKELREEDFDILIDRAMAEGNYDYPVPKVWGCEDFRKLLSKLI